MSDEGYGKNPNEDTSFPAELGRTFVWFAAIAIAFAIVGTIFWVVLK